MTLASNLIDLQTGLPHTGLSAHELVGFELGWDYAHHGAVPPAPYAEEASALRNGLLAGQAAFGARTLAATRHVRQWLQLRLHAWLRGRSVELVQVTPNYLQQIAASHCPITRTPLASATLATSDASVDRVRNDAGYAAGNLATMSVKANHAKAAWGHADARGFAQRIEAGQVAAIDGLGAAEWWRVATLCSFVEVLSHDEACELPMRVLPPNRLRLFNPVQALQAFVSHQLLKPGWSQRIARFEDLLPTPALRRDFKGFFMTLLPRVIEAGASGDKRGAAATRWAVEDAWCAPRVLQRWARFARQLSPAQCETLVARAAAHGLATQVVMALPAHGATEGWQLDTRGYVPHADNVTHRPVRNDKPQQHLAW
jgi:hypothetical protein